MSPRSSSSSSPTLHLSHHAATRIRQRGLRASDVALVLAHGTPVRDGFLLRTRDVAAAEAEMKRTVSRLHRLAGTFVAVAEDTVLSVYRPAKMRRRKLLATGAA
jgi:hypothetical protein